MNTILVTEDDIPIRRLMTETLRREGFTVREAANGEEALTALEREQFELLVTDLMMPKLDGIDLIREIRKLDREIPVLIITAKELFEDKKMGFLAGADDYMVKPIDMEEMVLRIRALLRRAKYAKEQRIEYQDTVLDYGNYLFQVKGKSIELARKEFEILFLLMSNPEKIFTRQQILDRVWGKDANSVDRTVDVHINRIREKLTGDEDIEIRTVRGLGYKLVRL